MTREQKIMRARGLKRLGWTAAQIGEVLGASPSTVRNWYLGGDCEGCGLPLADPRSARCASCVADDQVVWPRERVVAKVREWTSQYGEPPVATDWHPAIAWLRNSPTAALSQERYDAGDWPAAPTVVRLFGSWNAAIRAAGFVPCQPGHRRLARQAA